VHPEYWCADCDGAIYDYDFREKIDGKVYCPPCALDHKPTVTAADAEECHLEESRELNHA
jgi:uncharacterized Zn finger protein (UPF0148 family)